MVVAVVLQISMISPVAKEMGMELVKAPVMVEALAVVRAVGMELVLVLAMARDV